MRMNEINPIPVMIENLHLQALLAHTHPTLLIHPKSDRIVFANQAAANLLGRSIEELLATSVSALHKGQVPSLVVFSEAAFYNGFAWTRGLDMTRPDGTELKLEHEARPLILEGEEYLTVTISDLDARHRRDVDPFDAYCDHLLVIDLERGDAAKPCVVGTYRMLRGETAKT